MNEYGAVPPAISNAKVPSLPPGQVTSVEFAFIAKSTCRTGRMSSLNDARLCSIRQTIRLNLFKLY